MKQTELNIVYICDEAYAFVTLMSVRSLKAHRNKKYAYQVFIVTKDLSSQSVDVLEAESEKDTFRIVICTNHMEFSEILSEHVYVSKAALIKFALPSIFNHFDKVLYVDGDTLFREGFEKIFQINIDHAYAAVVKDMSTYFEGDHLQELGLKQYFNSGIMYLNLKKMRCDKIEQKLLEYKRNEKKKPMFMDQDAFNVIFHENVVFMHPRFNFIYDIFRRYTAEQIAEFYCISKREAAKLDQEAGILHMAGGKKPWNNLESEQLDEWLDYVQYVREALRWGQNTYGKNLIGLRADLSNVLAKLDSMQFDMQQTQAELNNNNESLHMLQEQILRIESNCNNSIQMLQEKVSNIENSFNSNLHMLQEQISSLNDRMGTKEREDAIRQRLYESIEQRLTSLENMILLRIYRKIRRYLKRT